MSGSSDQPASQPSKSSTTHAQRSSEHTPLLSRTDTAPTYNTVEPIPEPDEDANEDDPLIPSPAARSLRSLQDSDDTTSSLKKIDRRWPTVFAITILALAIVTIILGAFFAPAVIEEYAKESMVIEPTSLSIDQITPTGVSARVQATFRLDASKVKNKHVRTIGRFGTWLARKVESDTSTVKVYLPEFGNILLGTAVVPPIIVDIRNGRSNKIDFITNLEPGDMDGIRRMANDWLDGRLDKVRVLGKANVSLKSGLIHLGSQAIAESLVFEGQYLYRSFASLYFGEKTLV